MDCPPTYLRARVSSHSDVLCLSHLRWNWVYQRPQHLLTRAAKQRRVFFFEEPVYQNGCAQNGCAQDGGAARLAIAQPHPNVWVATPHLPAGLVNGSRDALLRDLLNGLIESAGLEDYLSWYYTPMALPFSRHLQPVARIYDCMDQLSAFAGAPPELIDLERELLDSSDLVFTGGLSLYEAKRELHDDVHCFPSGVDVEHFAAARAGLRQPDDQQAVPGPRLGYCGVIDERLDLPLLASLAQARPRWQVVLVGPVTKVDEAALPRAANIHYLGPKRYEDLPAYIGGWDVALMPFARNESTRYISPTKTPEYLAAGKPVVSTSIRDVVRTYGEPGLVRIADEPEAFVAAVEESLLDDPLLRLRRVDAVLRQRSWDKTWSRMQCLIDGVTVAPGLTAEAA
ncbi:glycosyltransferase family 1 protein [Nitrospira moscoviensis]|uniref:Putative Glycosyltransferase n=1 Tax=Nitrospira moscoviensis TaxID=42253 RepID=A0A0K2GE42_NITMO|nr:glycosyltransferase family 1 protein [Nitrospira moscoviensis]ALA59230.1 putative Glycosyltransferase [Nitrospira moscoviensis]